VWINRRLSVVPLQVLVALSVVATFAWTRSAHGFVITVVTTSADTDDPNDGQCSLREAIIAVNGSGNYKRVSS
jgi:CSLREA domain-containing protein